MPADMLSLTRLLQLASPTLPVGAYSYSGGLEYAIEDGKGFKNYSLILNEPQHRKVYGKEFVLVQYIKNSLKKTYL